MADTLDISLVNSLAELDSVRLAVEAFLRDHGVAGHPIHHMVLALDELLTNIISYGYSDQDEHRIRLIMSVRPCVVDIELRDDGKPFNPLDAPVPDTAAPLDERRIGGLGIHFVRKTMDVAAYERRDGNNILRLSKNTA